MENNKKDKIKLIAGILICIVFVSGAYLIYSNLQKNASPKLITDAPDSFEKETASGEQPSEESIETSIAPDFTVEDGDGNKISLRDFSGTPVIINVWASWCPPCKSEMPLFERKSKEYDGKIQFMMINLTAQDEIAEAKAFIADSGYTFPVFYDINNDVGQKYYTPGIPATFFINSKGEAVAYITGAINEETLEKGIELIGI